MDYSTFLKSKGFARENFGFKPVWMPDFLFDFQRVLCEWSIRKGRAAIFADCGLGKTPLQLVWAENIARKTNKNVLILAPLAVSPQTVREGEKFGISVHRTRTGDIRKGINVTNYQRLHYLNPKDFVGVALDEAGILKHFDGKFRKQITDFMNQVEYRLLCTATPAPNDFMELGCSSEALGVMTRNSMLGMFFTNDGETTQQWSLKGHAKKRFWQWMAMWARTLRKPSDLGFDDRKFILPKLNVIPHMVGSIVPRGRLMAVEATTLAEQRHEKRQSLLARCEEVAKIVPRKRPCIVWCQLNDEGDTLTELIEDAVQVSGSDPDDKKEEMLNAFSLGQIRVLVTKPSIACFGMNWQHCADVSYFPSHSHEAYYQAIRRCWRFGQTREVNCHLVYSEAEKRVLANMLRKERLADEMYSGVLRFMSDALAVKKEWVETNGKIEVPSWL